MTLADFSSLVVDCETLSQLENLIAKHLQEIRLYYYGLDSIQLKDRITEIESSFYSFKACQGYRCLETSGSQSTQIGSMLVFFASVFERTSNSENYNIASILPPSSIKYRLKAGLLAEEVNHLPTHYVKNFGEILELLARAQFDGDDEYTAIIINFLVKYYHTATAKLAAKEYFQEISELRAAYTNQFLLEKFPFLGHPLIGEILNGNTTVEAELEVVEGKSVLYYPSQFALAIFESEIINPVRNHPRTIPFHTLLGYSSQEVRDSIIQYGRADFTMPYKDLTADDRVLLYCYFNMRKHFFTTFFVFERIYGAMWRNLEQTKTVPVFIDLGCGPLTSGLALADLTSQSGGTALVVNYIGVDISKAMLKKAEAFWLRAVGHKLLSPNSKCSFYTNWNEIPEEILENYVSLHNPVFINASYLFASSTLDEIDLAKFVEIIANQYSNGNVYLIFQNPNRLDRNNKFNNFKGRLHEYETVDKNVERVYYKNNPSSSAEPSPEDVYFEILSLN